MVTFKLMNKGYGWQYYNVYLDGELVGTCDLGERSEVEADIKAQ